MDESNLLRNWVVEFDPWTLLAGAVGTARQGRNRLAMRLSAKAIGVLGQADGVHEHYLEGVLSLVRARALARLGQPGRAQDHFRIAASIVRRTTENEDHPWALMADFEYAWLRAQHDGAPREEAQNALHALEAALWPEHAEVRAAASLLART